jgi:hypothetical protein
MCDRLLGYDLDTAIGKAELEVELAELREYFTRAKTKRVRKALRYMIEADHAHRI